MGSIASKAVTPATWLRFGLLFVGLGVLSCATAQDAKPLTKAEVTTLVVGKKLQYTKASDGSSVTYDVRDNGRVYYAPQRTTRNVSIGGNYTIDDDGVLCFKWESSDRYVTMTDGCYLFKREGDKTQIFGRRKPDSPLGDVVE